MLNIVIDKNKCTLCGLCIDACPVACLKFDDRESVVLVNDLENCLICRNCEDHCGLRCLTVVFPEWQFRSSVAPEHLVSELPAVSELFQQGRLIVQKR
jgi:formate hydrogenlyase subunit 6/NADH:ubiquinone oxidoreductase subunit I